MSHRRVRILWPTVTMLCECHNGGPIAYAHWPQGAIHGFLTFLSAPQGKPYYFLSGRTVPTNLTGTWFSSRCYWNSLMPRPHALTLSLCATLLTLSPATFSYEIVKVEETWQLTVGEPNPDRNAPQATLVMSPFDDVENQFFVFELNHKVAPDYRAGGMQVCVYNGEDILTSNNGPVAGPIDQVSDVVRWTQVLSVENGLLTFEVVDGSSTSWGSFGGQGYLRSTLALGTTNLNFYRPEVSLTQSEVGYAGNRVVSLELVQIRWTMSDDSVWVLDAPIDIDSDLDPWE